MNKKRAIKNIYRALILVTVAIFILSFYNLIAFLGTAISGESFGLDLEENDSTGDFILSLSANPRNNGVLPASLYLEIKIFDIQANIIASNSTLLYIAASSNQTFSFSLIVPLEFVQEEEFQGDIGYMQMTMTVRTFGDLVGFTQVMKISGESMD